jgi:hypothetical protein
VSAFFRLLRYARPYRRRLASALLAMIVYGAAIGRLARRFNRSSMTCCRAASKLGATIA